MSKFKILFTFLLVFSLGASAATPAEETIKDYLMNNPAVVIEILKNAVEHERAQQSKSKEHALESARPSLTGKGRASFAEGSGNITLVEFFDYQCGYCKKAHPQVLDALKKDGKVKYIFKEFPILGKTSRIASRAAIAADRQGKYKKFHNALMSTPGKLTEKKIFSIARLVGLNVKTLRRDMNDKAVQHAIDENIELGQELGINGTPTFIIFNSREIQSHAGVLSTRELLALFKEVRSH